MVCEECGGDQWEIECKACGECEYWCENCQDACYFDPDHELCSGCFEKAEAEAEVARAEYARTVEINVDVLDLEENELFALAADNAIYQRMAYEQRAHNREEIDLPKNYDEFRGDARRAVINYLRHHATNYDAILDGLPKLRRLRTSDCDDDAYQTIKARVHEAIRQVYPFVSGFL